MKELFIKDQSKTKKNIHQSLFSTELLIDSGLFEGKLGKIILFYHYGEYMKKQLYTELADSLIDDLLKKIEIGNEVGLKKGISGITWGILHLIEQKFLNGNPSELLNDLDEMILAGINNVIDQGMDSGLAGILFYINSRIAYSLEKQNKDIFTEKYKMIETVIGLENSVNPLLIEQIVIMKHLNRTKKSMKMENKYVFSKILFGV